MKLSEIYDDWYERNCNDLQEECCYLHSEYCNDWYFTGDGWNEPREMWCRLEQKGMCPHIDEYCEQKFQKLINRGWLNDEAEQGDTIINDMPEVFDYET